MGGAAWVHLFRQLMCPGSFGKSPIIAHDLVLFSLSLSLSHTHTQAPASHVCVETKCSNRQSLELLPPLFLVCMCACVCVCASFKGTRQEEKSLFWLLTGCVSAVAFHLSEREEHCTFSPLVLWAVMLCVLGLRCSPPRCSSISRHPSEAVTALARRRAENEAAQTFRRLLPLPVTLPGDATQGCTSQSR